MSILARVTRNIVFKFSGEIFSRLLTFIFFIYVARMLGDAGLGEYSFVVSFATIFLVLADLGFNTLLIRDVAADKDKVNQYVGNINTLKVILSVICFIAMTVIISFSSYSQITVLNVQLAGLMALINSFIDYSYAIFNAFEKMHNEMMLKIINKIFIVSLGTLCLIFKPDVTYLLIGTLTANFLTIFIALIILIKNGIKIRFLFESDFFKGFLKQAIPMAITSICVLIYFRIDIVMLSYMHRSNAEIGWYSVGIRLIDAFAIFPYLIMTAIFPVLSSENNKHFKKIIKKSLKYLLILSIPLTIGGMLLAHEIIILLYGVKFINATQGLQSLILVLPFIFGNYVFVYALTTIKKQHLIAFNTFLCIPVNIILNLALIPVYGYIGAGISTVVTELVLFILNLYFVVKNKIIESET